MRYEKNVVTGEVTEHPDTPSALTAEQIAAIAAEHAKHVEDQAVRAENKANALVRFLTTKNEKQIKDKVEEDITDLASAKVFIARLAIAVGALLRD